jgi:hypothetical protein
MGVHVCKGDECVHNAYALCLCACTFVCVCLCVLTMFACVYVACVYVKWVCEGMCKHTVSTNISGVLGPFIISVKVNTIRSPPPPGGLQGR